MRLGFAVYRALSAEPSTAVRMLSKLLALGLVAGGRRLHARWAWWLAPRMGAARYRLNLVRHPLHVRTGVPADAVGCPCDMRSRPTLGVAA